jgi:hypothetical protein
VYVFVCILQSPFDQFIKRECPKKSGYLNQSIQANVVSVNTP